MTGIVTPIETVYLMVLVLVTVAFVSYLGRTGAVGIRITNLAQDAARTASMQPDPASARAAAERVVRSSPMSAQCLDGARAETRTNPSVDDTWQGGSVTVEITCVVDNRDLTFLWAPGQRTMRGSDTQIVERFRG